MTDQRKILRLPSGLLRVLGAGFGVALGIGNMVGSGIFRAPGAIVARTGTIGVALALLIICALQSLLSANLWAEVAGSVPLSGGTVVVIRRAFGDTAALVLGWVDALANAAGTAQAAAAAAGFLGMLVSALFPYPGAVAAGLIVSLVLINWGGVIVGERAQLIATAAQGAAIVALIGLLFGLPQGTPHTGAPTPLPEMLTVGGLTVGYRLVYGAFMGWNLPAYMAEETNDPGRTLPRALALSILGFTALFVLMLLGLAHALPLATMAGSDFPASVALLDALGPRGQRVLAVIALVAVVSCTNAGIMPGTRVLLALGRSGFAPRQLARVNPRGSPDVALALTALLCGGLAATGRYETIFLLGGTLAMAGTAAMDLAYFQLRRREPDLVRPFRAIGHPVLPIVALMLDIGILSLVAIADLWGVGYAAILVSIGCLVARLAAARRGDVAAHRDIATLADVAAAESGVTH